MHLYPYLGALTNIVEQTAELQRFTKELGVETRWERIEMVA